MAARTDDTVRRLNAAYRDYEAGNGGISACCKRHRVGSASLQNVIRTKKLPVAGEHGNRKKRKNNAGENGNRKEGKNNARIHAGLMAMAVLR